MKTHNLLTRLSFILLTFYLPTVFASVNTITAATNCQTLKCVRTNIDIINEEIVNLIGQRLTYVKRAGELKKNVSSVYDQARENKILETVAQLEKKAGYPPSIAIAIFKTILAQSVIYEKRFHQKSGE